MKFRNLLGVTSCLLIAFSGTSYAQSPPSLSSPPSYPSPPSVPSPAPTIPFVAPSIPLTGGSVPSDITGTGNTGVTEKDENEPRLSAELRKAEIKKGEADAAKLARDIIGLIFKQETEKTDWPNSLFSDIGRFLTLMSLNDLSSQDRLMGAVVIQKVEFALRTISARYERTKARADCDSKCKAYNSGAAEQMGFIQSIASIVLYNEGLTPLQSRIPK